jgi:hypothetical protein
MLFLKTTLVTAGPGVYMVDIAAKPPGKTFGVYMAVDADNPPQELISAIEALGFKRKLASPYTHNDGTKVLDLHYHKTGTDIFEGWTLPERDANLQALETLFAAVKITIQPRVMTLAEAF